MRLSFLIGLIAGLIAAGVVSFAAPMLQQERQRALTSVETNGGRLEIFRIDLNRDILSQSPGTASAASLVPNTAEWFPELAPFAGIAAVYRLRDTNGIVVGIASRVRGMRAPEQVEWILHLPARGMLALEGASDDTVELGDIVAGDREFADLAGDWDANIDSNNILLLRTTVRAAELNDDADSAEQDLDADVEQDGGDS